MEELVFINRNVENWKKFEKITNAGSYTTPDILAEMFIRITDDLAYSRTFYPDSNTERYLNSLAAKVHLSIYRNKKEKGSKIIKFWKYDFPLVMYDIKNYLLVSFCIFFIATFLGIYSAKNDPEYVRVILGDQYVDMTIHNIKSGDPMAIYKSGGAANMFMGITFNNIKVSFMAFIGGLLFFIGSFSVLFYNGVMLGSFQYFFYQYGVLNDSLLSIWIHGTLEIFAIIVSGAAGLLLGGSFIFPGTYSRISSFINGAKKGIKIIIGIMPFFIVAGFLEGFITRYTQAPVILRLSIIVFSLIFIIWYFILYPKKIYLKQKNLNKNEQLD